MLSEDIEKYLDVDESIPDKDEQKASPEPEKQEVVKEAIPEKQEAENSPDREFTEFEKEQMAKGWKPGGKKSAEQWAADGDKIEVLMRKIEEQGSVVKELKSHLDKKEQLGYQKALEELKANRTAAIHLQDEELVNKYDKAIAEHTKQQAPKETPKEAQDFLERYKDIFNSQDPDHAEIREWVLKKDSEYYAQGLPPDQAISKIEQAMLRKYNIPGKQAQEAEEDDTPRRAASVESENMATYGSKAIKSQKITFKDLSPQEQKIAKQYEKFEVMTVDEYLKDINEFRGLK